MKAWRVAVPLVGAAAACASFSATPGETTSSPDDAGANDVVTPIADAGVFSCSDYPDATSCLDFDNLSFAPWQLEATQEHQPTFVEAGLSPPWALSTELTVSNSTTGAISRIYHSIPSDAQEVRLTFDVNLDPALALTNDGGQVTLAEFLCVQNNAVLHGCFVNVNADGTVGLVTGLPPGPGSVPLSTGRWHHLVVDAHFNGGVTFSVDGTMGETSSLASCPTDSIVTIGLGSASHQAAAALYDDVLYELNPL